MHSAITKHNAVNTQLQNLLLQKQQLLYRYENIMWEERPSFSGWYWWKIRGGDTINGPIYIEKIKNGIYLCRSDGFDFEYDPESGVRVWAGPVARPK